MDGRSVCYARFLGEAAIGGSNPRRALCPHHIIMLCVGAQSLAVSGLLLDTIDRSRHSRSLLIMAKEARGQQCQQATAQRHDLRFQPQSLPSVPLRFPLPGSPQSFRP